MKYFRGVPNFKRDFPCFPDLSFAEFVRLANEAFETHLDCPSEVWKQFGWRTRAFANFYFKKPGAALTKMLDDNYIFAQTYKTDLFENLHFIRTKNLNRELYDFLFQNGYRETDLEFILAKKKVMPLGRGRTEEQKWEKYFTPELKNEIRQKERPLFEMFSEFDV